MLLLFVFWIISREGQAKKKPPIGGHCYIKPVNLSFFDRLVRHVDWWPRSDLNRDITPYEDAPLTDCDTGPWRFMVDSNNHIKLRRLALFPVELMKLN